MLQILLLVVGLALLIVGAELLVRGASRIARAVGISPLVVGLTVVAFGTSSPEIAVTVQSALAGQSDLAIGNVVGSNIFNLLVILGLSAVITPLVISRQVVRLDLPLMIVVTALVLPLAWNGLLGRIEGIILLLLLAGYIGLLLRLGGNSPEEKAANADAPRTGLTWIVDVGLIVVGLAMLVLGSRWLVDGALAIARSIGISELIVGLTIVAAGTSLPEVATSVIAAIRGERDIAVGNVVGSCTFNVLAVLGVASAVAPAGIAVSAAAIGFDIPIMIVVSLATYPIFRSGHVVSRAEGAVFLFYYVAYTSYLILQATEHDALPVFNVVLLAFVIPITLLTAVMVTLRRRHDTELVRMHRFTSRRTDS